MRQCYDLEHLWQKCATKKSVKGMMSNLILYLTNTLDCDYNCVTKVVYVQPKSYGPELLRFSFCIYVPWLHTIFRNLWLHNIFQITILNY